MEGETVLNTSSRELWSCTNDLQSELEKFTMVRTKFYEHIEEDFPFSQSIFDVLTKSMYRIKALVVRDESGREMMSFCRVYAEWNEVRRKFDSLTKQSNPDPAVDEDQDPDPSILPRVSTTSRRPGRYLFMFQEDDNNLRVQGNDVISSTDPGRNLAIETAPELDLNSDLNSEWKLATESTSPDVQIVTGMTFSVVTSWPYPDETPTTSATCQQYQEPPVAETRLQAVTTLGLGAVAPEVTIRDQPTKTFERSDEHVHDRHDGSIESVAVQSTEMSSSADSNCDMTSTGNHKTSTETTNSESESESHLNNILESGTVSIVPRSATATGNTEVSAQHTETSADKPPPSPQTRSTPTRLRVSNPYGTTRQQTVAATVQERFLIKLPATNTDDESKTRNSRAMSRATRNITRKPLSTEHSRTRKLDATRKAPKSGLVRWRKSPHRDIYPHRTRSESRINKMKHDET